MNETGKWRELYRCDSLGKARTVVTSISAMEFEVRLRDGLTGQLVDPEMGSPPGSESVVFSIEAREEDWGDLDSVLEEIIDEQREFDAFLESWHSLSGRAQLICFAVAGIIALVIAVLAVMD